MAIDEVSKTIGKFETMLEAHGDTLVLIQDGIKDIRNYQQMQNGKVDKLHARVDDLEEEAVTKTDVMKTAIAIGGVGGISGMGIWTAVKAYLGIA